MELEPPPPGTLLSAFEKLKFDRFLQIFDPITPDEIWQPEPGAGVIKLFTVVINKIL
jgi:hypothetical protein